MLKKLRVWHVPQIPMKAFYVNVESIEEAIKIIDVLSSYDIFQYENNVKPDFCNMNGLQEWDEKDCEWYEWYSEDGLSIHEFANMIEEQEVSE